MVGNEVVTGEYSFFSNRDSIKFKRYCSLFLIPNAPALISETTEGLSGFNLL